ncbi:MAG: TIGR02444 family protein [Alkalimonas sp.]|nr:TIGR02444 family protein [Alkalimonas sp.]
MVKGPSTEQFWQFCLASYPGIQQPLLRLQDELGANVNLLLLLLYAEQQHWILTPQQIDRLHQAVAGPNHSYTQPIRNLRRRLSTQPAIKAALLQAELVAEQLEQQALLAALPELTTGQDADLIAAYLTQLTPSSAHWHPLLFDLRQSLSS